MLGRISTSLCLAALAIVGATYLAAAYEFGHSATAAACMSTVFFVAGALVLIGALTAIGGLIADRRKWLALLGLVLNGAASIAWAGLAWLAYVFAHANPHDMH